MKFDQNHPLYWPLKQFDHTGSLRTRQPDLKAIWQRLHERGLIQRAIRYAGAFEITQKGRDALKGGE
jgi:hypothetical protein